MHAQSCSARFTVHAWRLLDGVMKMEGSHMIPNRDLYLELEMIEERGKRLRLRRKAKAVAFLLGIGMRARRAKPAEMA